MNENKLPEFLEIIGQKENKLYENINFVYVPPLEYEEIWSLLKDKRLVIITGPPEYGKTYTAIYILWRYFSLGYTPKWIRREELNKINEKEEIIKFIEKELIPQHIIYYEDPFGKIKYEWRESLENEIKKIVEIVENYENVFVIITSREEIFKKFEEEVLQGSILKIFEKKLKIKKPSYDYEKRKEILIKWATLEKCKWIKNEDLRNFVMRLLENPENLPTPLSIREFVISSINTIKKEDLNYLFEEKSKKTSQAFALEIKNMSDDKKIFLSILSILDAAEISTIKSFYQDLVYKFNLEYTFTFDEIIDWFKDDKIEIYFQKYIRFSHPSYSEAVKFLFFNDKGFKEIYRKILFYLSRKDKAIRNVSIEIDSNFSRFDKKDLYNLISILFDNIISHEYLPKILLSNYNELSNELKELIFFLTEKEAALPYIADAIAYNFKNLPEDITILLFKLAEKEKYCEIIADAIVSHFHEVSKSERELLIEEISKIKEDSKSFLEIIILYFEELPEKFKNLILDSVENDKYIENIANLFFFHFNELSEDFRNDLLTKLVKKEEAIGYIIKTIGLNFSKLPEDIKSIFFELTKNKQFYKETIEVIGLNFKNLPKEVKNLLYKFSEIEETAPYVALALDLNFDNIPLEFKNELLRNLSKREETSFFFIMILSEHSNEIPENLMNELLLNSAKISETIEELALFIRNNFEVINANVRYEILLSIIENVKEYTDFKTKEILTYDKYYGDISEHQLALENRLKNFRESSTRFLINIDTVPLNIRTALLIDLMEKLGEIKIIFEESESEWEKIPNEQKKNIIKFWKKDRIAMYIVDIITSNIQKLPNKIIKSLIELTEQDHIAEGVAKAVNSNFDKIPESLRDELLIKLSKKRRAKKIISNIINLHFNKVEDEIKKEIQSNISAIN